MSYLTGAPWLRSHSSALPRGEPGVFGVLAFVTLSHYHPDMLTLRDFSTKHRIPYSTVCRWAKDGTLPTVEGEVTYIRKRKVRMVPDDVKPSSLRK